jgi:hypothetical protein
MNNTKTCRRCPDHAPVRLREHLQTFTKAASS